MVFDIKLIKKGKSVYCFIDKSTLKYRRKDLIKSLVFNILLFLFQKILDSIDFLFNNILRNLIKNIN